MLGLESGCCTRSVSLDLTAIGFPVTSYLRAQAVEWKADEVNITGNTTGFRGYLTQFINPARRLLKSLSIKQGMKYDSPDSARDIPTFIDFHQLNKDEILDPLDSFSTYPLSVHFLTIGNNHSRNIQRVLLSVCSAFHSYHSPSS